MVLGEFHKEWTSEERTTHWEGHPQRPWPILCQLNIALTYFHITYKNPSWWRPSMKMLFQNMWHGTYTTVTSTTITWFFGYLVVCYLQTLRWCDPEKDWLHVGRKDIHWSKQRFETIQHYESHLRNDEMHSINYREVDEAAITHFSLIYTRSERYRIRCRGIDGKTISYHLR